MQRCRKHSAFVIVGMFAPCRIADAALTIATKRCTITLKIQERQNEQIGKVLGSIR